MTSTILLILIAATITKKSFDYEKLVKHEAFWPDYAKLIFQGLFKQLWCTYFAKAMLWSKFWKNLESR